MSNNSSGLRIYFSRDDLLRIRLTDSADLMWETVNSLHLLQHRGGALFFDPWRDAARRALLDGGAGERALRFLLALAPYASYCPDFLTPADAGPSPDLSVETVLSTPVPRIREELRVLSDHGHASPALGLLARGGPDAMRLLGHALRIYHRAALTPFWSRIRAHVHADLIQRVRTLRGGGAEALLSSLGPEVRWRPPVLEADYPFDRELHLNGRGLLLTPSFFCWARPVMLADPELPPVLVYPVERSLDWAQRTPRPTSLEPLIGSTRSRLLALVAEGGVCTTTGLARTATVSPATVSKHLNVLREAGLVRSRQEGKYVLHGVTDLGLDLLRRS
ncbi:ArsR/SmtB family transcription factor [Nocardiopsis quinghaiensis]|uniref:ArsR/SmtB family transcription factor n=1 Tax=Nocardiopsis quinghaiensis TaxID=464995 RepID=UPI00123C77ED|nr:winged helix-turn-helix domain-containing protein [Nocardiopsis quinghaiensis]